MEYSSQTLIVLETGRELPKVPTVFVKPATAVAGPFDSIRIPEFAGNQLDYEGELTIVIGKTGKNISKDDALDYVAGYATSNDVSARDWQRDVDKAGPLPQWCYGKSFDQFAPLGPCLVSPEVLGAAENLALKTTVNGELRQSTNTNDLVFGVRDLVAFCSRGQTLQKGSLIMTGTCGGVGLFMKPSCFLKHGDVVTVSIEGIGAIENRFVWE
jgi:2-keto-4-pentenoate hydratase/2-oxohepta-3-ene-1,7-dioic acid hydratase in catechol pathway